MEALERAVSAIAQGRSILFVGSGFSKAAQNYNDHTLLLAAELADHFSTELGEDTGIALETISGQFLDERGPDALCEEIKRLFTVKTVRPEQVDVASAPWHRVYTTNYDDVLEVCLRGGSKRPDSLTRTNAVRDAPAEGLTIIHLNGYVQAISPTNVRKEILLTDYQYLTNELRDSPWATRLRADIHGAKNVFFVGYSLYDFDITKILLESGAVGKKVFFIQHEALKSADQKRLSRFGDVHTMGLPAFAALLKQLPPPSPSDISPGFLVNFRELHQFSGAPSRAGPEQARALFASGALDREALLWDISNGQSTYRVRRDPLDQIESLLGQHSQSLFVYADIGNGKKTLSAEIMEMCLARGKRCFRYEPKTRELSDDLRYLQRSGDEHELVLLIPNYYDYEEIVRNLRSALPRSTMVALATASTRQLREAPTPLTGESIYEFQIDTLSDREVRTLNQLLYSFGRWGDLQAKGVEARDRYIKDRCARALRSVVLGLFDQEDIRKQLATVFQSVLDEDGRTRGSVIRILAVTAFGHDLSFGEMCEVVGTEFANDLLRSKKQWVKEFFDVRAGRFCFESAVLAQYMLRHLVDDRTVLDELAGLALRLHRSAWGDETFRRLRQLPLRFSMVERLLEEEGKAAKLTDYYEGLRREGFASGNPLFWLQYGIARKTFKDYANAKTHFDTAFALAKSIAGYDDYQIKNHWARHLLESAIDGRCHIDAFDAFEEAHEIVAEQADEKRHGVFPYRVAAIYLDFIKAVADDLSSAEVNAFADACEVMLQRIELLDEPTRRHNEVAAARLKLRKAKEIAAALQ